MLESHQPSELDELERRYAEASDDELREASKLGKESYRPVAWNVIQAEIRRRGDSFRPRSQSPIGRVRAGIRPAKWTTGLTLGLIIAVPLVIETFRRMVKAGVGGGPRGGGGWILFGIFVIVWFGVALLYDLSRWLWHRRNGHHE